VSVRLFVAVAAIAILPARAVWAQSAEDTVQVQLSVARVLQPSLGPRILLESRERPVNGQTARRENPWAARVARTLSAQLAHKEDAMTCTRAIYCTLKEGVDRFLVINVVQLSGDSAAVEVSEWVALGGSAASRTKSFGVTRTPSGWVAKQGEWIVQY
jgi:hypothetical protein